MKEGMGNEVSRQGQQLNVTSKWRDHLNWDKISNHSLQDLTNFKDRTHDLLGAVPTELTWRRCKCNWFGATDQWFSVKPGGTFGFPLINHLPNVTAPLPGRLFFGIVIPFSEIPNFNCKTLQEYSGETLSTGLDITLKKQTSFYNRLLLDLTYRFLTLLSSDGRDN